MNKLNFLPLWVWVVVCIEIAAPVLFASVTLLDTAAMFPGTEEITAPIALYVVRNYAVAFGLVLAAFVFRSTTAVLTLILVRMAMDVPDIVNSFVIGASDDVLKMIPVFFVLFVVLPTAAVWKLWPQVQRECFSA